MLRRTIVGVCVLGLILAAAAPAQQEGDPGDDEMAAMMEAYRNAAIPGEPHAMLAKGVGSWKMTARMWLDPAGEPTVSEGIVERQMILGGRVLAEQASSQMMGQAFEGVGHTGFDNVTGQYWSAWMDNMSTGCYVFRGSMDSGGTLVYRGEFDDPMTGGRSRVRYLLRWQGDDKQLMEWYEDRGQGEIKTMEITYERQG